MLLAFDFIANWSWKKQRNLLATNLLYILFFLDILHNFFKKIFEYFQMNILTDFIPPMTKFSIETREIISEKFYVSNTSLLTSIPENFSP